MVIARRVVLGSMMSAALLSHTRALGAQQANDVEYTAKIRELTPTDPMWKFTTELVDHLPASATVPTPLKVLGYVPGTVGKLSRTEDINKYFRAVAAASPRVKLFSLGMSEEGREMIIAAVSDSQTIAHLDDYRLMAAKLADPRGVAAQERARLIHESKPLYWLTGTIHAPETGSPEMLMELLYRLAVEDSPYVKEIRDHVITLITPATEVDGRNRIVDLIEEEKALKLGRGGIPTVYWGKYIAHDNNRDGLMMSIKLTQNMNTGFLFWHPTIMHDLHESVPFLYTSTGTGPYNDEFDPIVVDEWHTLAYQEITELTKRGLPGVWTHGFYDGWAPNYMLGIAQFRNSLGKFYETYTSGGADCQIVKLQPNATSREWDRPNPPVNGVKWCIRSNINYQQSGVMVALNYVAKNHDTFMENFALKATRMVERGQRSAPYAFVIPHDQKRAAEAGDLINYFRKIGSEVQVATADFTATAMPAVIERGLVGGGAGPAAGAAPAAGGRGGAAPAASGDSAGGARRDSTRSRSMTTTVHAGDWIVRMDQPYTALVRTVLALQRFRPDDPSPYDDTGWSLDQLRHVTVHTIADSAVLSKPMTLLKTDVVVEGAVNGTGGTLAVNAIGDWRSATLPWKVGKNEVRVADTAFVANGTTFAAGTYLLTSNAATLDAVKKLGLKATSLAAAPTVRAHTLALPRIAFVHTWIETQNEGWVRHALEEMGVPFKYMSTQSLKQKGLLDKYDVVLFPHVGATPAGIVNGRPMIGPAVPWKKTPLTPNIGVIDSTDDIRPGLGYDGLAALKAFVDRGGLLVTEGNSSRLPVEFGFAPSVSITATPRLLARGAVFKAQAMDRTSPILYGYDEPNFSVYFNTAPLFTVATGNGPQGEGVDSASRAVAQNAADPMLEKQANAQRARVVLRFTPRADSLLVSGLLDNGAEMAGRAAVVDAPVGKGHVVMFGIRPMWRYETQGSYAMMLNAMLNWNALDVNQRSTTTEQPKPPAKEEY
ncbi:MAG: M14 family zinc carboxypeptidase [bacterium]